jgi:uncharacterized protein (TIGR02145 family)
MFKVKEYKPLSHAILWIVLIAWLGVLVSCKEKNPAILETGTMTDNDGIIYKTVKIGNQWWMVENLKGEHYRNGDAIRKATNNLEWANLSSGAYCSYNNNPDNVDVYGYLYNWYAVNDPRNIAPSGWHAPTNEEWKELIDFLGGEEVAGGKLKEKGTSHWKISNTRATNETLFSALPGGFRSDFDSRFGNLGNYAYFWSTTESSTFNAWNRNLNSANSYVNWDYSNKQSGFSVRLVRDN